MTYVHTGDHGLPMPFIDSRYAACLLAQNIYTRHELSVMSLNDLLHGLFCIFDIRRIVFFQIYRQRCPIVAIKPENNPWEVIIPYWI